MKKRVTIDLLPVFLLTIFYFCGCAGYKKGYYSRTNRIVKETRVTTGDGYNYWYYDSDQVRQLPLAQGEKILLDKNKWNYFALYFNGPVPVVDQDIQLDLSEAISLPDGLSIPVIRFKKVRYGKWYG
jgi:hypothetical protein